MKEFIRLNKVISTLIGIGTLIGLLFAGSQIGWGFFSSQFASASDFKLVAEDIQSLHNSMKKMEERLDRKLASDELNDKQTRLWRLQDKFQNKNVPPEILEEEHSLQLDIENIKESMKQWNSGHR